MFSQSTSQNSNGTVASITYKLFFPIKPMPTPSEIIECLISSSKKQLPVKKKAISIEESSEDKRNKNDCSANAISIEDSEESNKINKKLFKTNQRKNTSDELNSQSDSYTLASSISQNETNTHININMDDRSNRKNEKTLENEQKIKGKGKDEENEDKEENKENEEIIEENKELIKNDKIPKENSEKPTEPKKRGRPPKNLKNHLKEGVTENFKQSIKVDKSIEIPFKTKSENNSRKPLEKQIEKKIPEEFVSKKNQKKTMENPLKKMVSFDEEDNLITSHRIQRKLTPFAANKFKKLPDDPEEKGLRRRLFVDKSEKQPIAVEKLESFKKSCKKNIEEINKENFIKETPRRNLIRNDSSSIKKK